MTNGTLAELNVLVIVALVIVGAFAAFSLVASIWKWILMFRYSAYNKMEVKAGLTGEQTAKELLKGLKIDDVEVVKCGFFASLFVGNSYNPFKKQIKLRKNIFDKSSLTAVAVASQKVAIAQRDHDKDKKIKVRTVFTWFGYFAPFAVVPLIVIGAIVDFVTIHNLGWATIILTIIAAVWYIASFVVVCLNIPIEKRACKTAVEYFQKTNLLNEEEIEVAQKLYKTYLINYVLDFISELLYLLWRILKFICKFVSIGKKK